MGNSGSKSDSDAPWRIVNWGKTKKDSLKEDIKNMQPCRANLKCLRVMVVGPCGSGKSSFINSVNNAFRGLKTSKPSDSNDNKSSTKYKEFKIETGNSKLSIIFNDVMSLESDDILNIIKGNMRNGHEFNPKEPLSPDDPDYNKDPEVYDKVSCMVYILPADRLLLTDNSVLNKLRTIHLKVSETFGLPQVIVMTNVDQACPLVRNNLKSVYKSKQIKQKMEWCSIVLGVSMCHIFPVKNYSTETETNDDIDVLILQATSQIIQLSNDNEEIQNVQHK